MDNKPLQGIRILDFGWILSVPHCTAWLGALGADVIRVESFTSYDQLRAGLVAGVADGISGLNRSAAFNSLNYSKRSITLNLANPEGAGLAKELVKVSDVVTENYATGVMERWGLGYEVLRAVKQDIIMFTGSTLGTTGPERHATGWGPNSASYAGLSVISGYQDGPPADLGGTWPDYMIGTMMAGMVMSALHYRRRTGKGQRVEVAMGETVTATIGEAILDFTMNGRQRPRTGNRDDMMAPHNVYRCKGEDTWTAIAVRTEEEWRALCHAADHLEWLKDPRFASLEGRKRFEDELDALITEWTRQHTPYEVTHALQAAGVAAGPVLDIVGLMIDPHLQERGFVVEMDHPEVGKRTVAGLPARFSAMPQLAYTSAPLLGEHNEAVFCGLLGMSKGEFARLCEAGTIG
ncbi:MAG: CoA transferase [Chloroflexi bacterium]|nr:CoA transferase [Chloroflexota bacterium]